MSHIFPFYSTSVRVIEESEARKSLLGFSRGRQLREPHTLDVGAQASKSATALIRNLLSILNAERLCEDRWRLPDKTIICGTIDDMARSVDCVKQLEAHAYRTKPHEAGEAELMVASKYTGAGWQASITPFIGCHSKCVSGLQRTEALARVEALIALFTRSIDR